LWVVQTYVPNFDSIYLARDLALVTADRNGTIRLSRPMVEDCRRIAAEMDQPIKAGPISTGGRVVTDAVRFAEIGMEAVSIIGLSTALIRDGLVSHTPNAATAGVQRHQGAIPPRVRY
jgi:hypothetical protein